MYFVYILKSESDNKTYVGYTNNLERRLQEHNSEKSKFTSRFIPWRIVHKEEFVNRIDARARELYFKSSAGRKLIKRILKNNLPT